MSVELLAPAGSLERAKTAIEYGADAVYVGGQEFSLRSRASNFTIKQIAELVEFAHDRDAKVHVTVNIIPHPGDLENLKSYLHKLNEAGIDAIISASPAVLSTALAMDDRHFEVHVSTQRSVLNASAVRFWKNQGVDRVVLGRETPVESMEEICRTGEVPIEAFIHGGMCISFSGRCVLSNHMTRRDANRGGCAQSCRWKYELSDSDQILSDPDTPYSMSSRDLQSVRWIEPMINAGICSLKIEGRMKSDYYLAVVVGAYRRLIDWIESGRPVTEEMLAEIEDELSRAENRPTGPGFYNGLPDEHVQLYRPHDESVRQEYIADVLDVLDDGWLSIQVRNRFEASEAVELFGPGLPPHKGIIESIVDENELPMMVCPHPMQIVKIRWAGPAKKGCKIRRQRMTDPDPAAGSAAE